MFAILKKMSKYNLLVIHRKRFEENKLCTYSSRCMLALFFRFNLPPASANNSMQMGNDKIRLEYKEHLKCLAQPNSSQKHDMLQNDNFLILFYQLSAPRKTKKWIWDSLN